MARTGRKPIKIDLGLIEKYAALGMTNVQIAACLGINRATLSRRKATNSDFCSAYNRGLAQGILVVASRLMEQVSSGNLQAMKFYLETKAGWTTTPVIRACDLDISNMTAAEIRTILAEALRETP